MKIKNKSLEQVRAFYGKKYTKIFDTLENINATNFKVDEECGRWLELWCDIKSEHIKINIGIDDKFHTSRSYSLDCHEHGSFRTQSGVVNYLNNTYLRK